MNILYGVIAVVAGMALFVFGGYDDSPGAQGLGLLIVVIAIWRFYRRRR